MATEVKTVLKNFNRDLLFEELQASALPFIAVHLYGFDRLGFIAVPRAEQRLITGDGNNPQNNDYAQPGELRFEVTTALTGAESTTLDGLLAAHDSTQRTAEQQRLDQDTNDMDTLVANFPNFDTFSDAQFRSFVKVLARAYIRERRAPPI
jgi:hypothetical protein